MHTNFSIEKSFTIILNTNDLFNLQKIRHVSKFWK